MKEILLHMCIKKKEKLHVLYVRAVYTVGMLLDEPVEMCMHIEHWLEMVIYTLAFTNIL